MDPMEYLLHSDEPRSSSHQDAAAAAAGHAAGPWAAPPLSGSQTFPWPPHPVNHMAAGAAPQPPPLSSHPLPVPGSFFHGRPGGLPPPLSHGSRGLPPQDPFMPTRQWNSSLPQIPGPIPPVPAPLTHHAGHGGGSQEPSFTPGSRGLNFQPPAGSGVVPPGATSDRQSLPPRWFPSPESASSAPGQPNTSHFDLSSSTTFPSTPPHQSGHFSFTSSRRHSRSDVSAAPFPPMPIPPQFTLLPSPTSERRRPGHPRARRSMAARLTTSDPVGDDHDGPATRSSHEISHGTPRRGTQSVSNVQLEDIALRQMQVLRGAATIKMVASKKTLQSLESVAAEELPESERTCVICYNEFGVETPEGINEAPLRLPICKHVFGDHCIKKWFEDSDSCPYCRDKVHSEPKHQGGNARTFMNMMRLRGSLPANIPEEFFMRVMSPSSSDPLFADLGTGRRSPPDDTDEPQRRTRPRRSGSISRVPVSPSRSGNRRAPYAHPAPSSPDSYATHEPAMPRHSYWVPPYNPAHRRTATFSTLQPDASRRLDPSNDQFSPRYSTQPGGAAQDGFAPAGTFLAGTGSAVQETPTPLPNPLQAHGGGSERAGDFSALGSRVNLGNGPDASSGTAARQAVGTGPDGSSRHRQHPPW